MFFDCKKLDKEELGNIVKFFYDYLKEKRKCGKLREVYIYGSGSFMQLLLDLKDPADWCWRDPNDPRAVYSSIDTFFNVLTTKKALKRADKGKGRLAKFLINTNVWRTIALPYIYGGDELAFRLQLEKTIGNAFYDVFVNQGVYYYDPSSKSMISMLNPGVELLPEIYTAVRGLEWSLLFDTEVEVESHSELLFGSCIQKINKDPIIYRVNLAELPVIGGVFPYSLLPDFEDLAESEYHKCHLMELCGRLHNLFPPKAEIDFMCEIQKIDPADAQYIAEQRVGSMKNTFLFYHLLEE